VRRERRGRVPGRPVRRRPRAEPPDRPADDAAGRERDRRARPPGAPGM
ncbi:MAG: NAD(P)H dehydrogenase (quinone) 2, partial [uncultured Gemmatimonadaceae bacterium]